MKNNIYEFKLGGATEWISSPTILEAIKWYMSLTGIVIDEIEEVNEVDKKHWDKPFIRDENGKLISFSWLISKQHNIDEIQIIASTEI